jgi:tetratricopeptide (TPR) repeat protein
MAFVLYRKSDYNSGIGYCRNVIENSKDNNAIFIAKRLLAFIHIEMEDYPPALKLLEELKEDCSREGLNDELKIILYDIGFAYLAHTRNDEASLAWNELFQMDRNFRNIMDISVRLRQEMEAKPGSKADTYKPVITELRSWKRGVFHRNFLWDICGLKSDERLDLLEIISDVRDSSNSTDDFLNDERDEDRISEIGDIYKLNIDAFERISIKLCEKLGFTIDEVMSTYRGSDGLDLMATQKDGKVKTLICIRRWKDTNIGEIPLRNFAQTINDVNAKQGYFITTSPLSAAGESVLNSLEKVKVIFPEELIKHLKGIS